MYWYSIPYNTIRLTIYILTASVPFLQAYGTKKAYVRLTPDYDALTRMAAMFLLKKKQLTRSAMKEKGESCEVTMTMIEQQGAAVMMIMMH
ncbi:unnamed protein product [Lathyrus sativus]|nr:unnamed protein product [Lathyrus sativus]